MKNHSRALFETKNSEKFFFFKIFCLPRSVNLQRVKFVSFVVVVDQVVVAGYHVVRRSAVVVLWRQTSPRVNKDLLVDPTTHIESCYFKAPVSS
jgi:hypothetical protein